MSAITFLTICTVIVGGLIVLFFWLTEGGGSLEKIKMKLGPAWNASKAVATYLQEAFRQAGKQTEQRKSLKLKQLRQPQSRQTTSSIHTELPELDGRLPGPGDFSFPVVGESHYQKNLRQVEKKHGRGYEEDGEALIASIVTEPENPHDKNACAVYIEGLRVGYLSRGDAASYVRQMASHGIRGVSHFHAKAKLIGGYGDKKHYGVMLDLPVIDD
ncbi:HIRAN domain-containing protein [Pseudomonas boanensis]|uniref:HIRAN domain-containing protein n=1 Tax=Metapseudomonas boanensis TaxID=2822138 RepID=UPI0035D3FE86